MTYNQMNEEKWNTAIPSAKAAAIRSTAMDALGDRGNIVVGTPLYTYTDCKLWTVKMVHHPYTVTEIKGNKMKIRKARLIFKGTRYFDTLPDGIEADPNGEERTLRYDSRKDRWVVTPKDLDPEVAVFGRYDYQPYLD